VIQRQFGPPRYRTCVRESSSQPLTRKGTAALLSFPGPSMPRPRALKGAVQRCRRGVPGSMHERMPVWQWSLPDTAGSRSGTFRVRPRACRVDLPERHARGMLRGHTCTVARPVARMPAGAGGRAARSGVTAERRTAPMRLARLFPPRMAPPRERGRMLRTRGRSGRTMGALQRTLDAPSEPSATPVRRVPSQPSELSNL
jgi:hypothetical protein